MKPKLTASLLFFLSTVIIYFLSDSRNFSSLHKVPFLPFIGISIIFSILIFLFYSKALDLINKLETTKQAVVLKIFVFICSFIFALSTYHIFKFSPQADIEVIGNATFDKINPMSNFLRMLYLILFPCVVLFIVMFFRKKNEPKISKPITFDFEEGKRHSLNKYFLLISIVLVFFVTGSSYMYSDGVSELDTFHEGESLGPATDYLHGKKLYSETIFLHGAISDPLTAVWAFKLFGKSIGSFRALYSMNTILTHILLIIILLILFRKNGKYILFALLVLYAIQFFRIFNLAFYIPNKEIPLLLFLLMNIILYRKVFENNENTNQFTIGTLLFFSAFISIFSLAIAVERGAILFLTGLIFNFLIVFVVYRQKYLLSIFSLTIGYILGFIALGACIDWSFKEFIEYSFVILPKYFDVMSAFEYSFRIWFYMAPILLISINCYILASKFVSVFRGNNLSISDKIKECINIYYLDILFLFLSVLFYRNAIARPDWGHVAYSLFMTHLLLICNLIPAIFRNSRFRLKWNIDYFALGSLFILFSIFYIQRTEWKHFYRFPLGIADEEFIPKNYNNAINFLKTNLSQNDKFLCLTNEASWYYFLDKPCPVRFPSIYFAAPVVLQKEVVNQLDTIKNIKYVLYKSKAYWNRIDGIYNEKRLSLVYKKVQELFVPDTVIDGQEFWRKR